MQRFRTIVLGLGAMGSATLYQLARRGHDVLGLDRFAPPHPFGSTHGDTRITREAIGEGDAYVPLARRSHAIWRELEQETGRDLLRQVGCLVISSPAPRATTHVPSFFQDTLETAARHGIPHERLDAGAIRRRFPQYLVRDDEVGYFEPVGGFLRVEECVRAQLDMAARHGAMIHTGETALRFDPGAGALVVTTDRGVYAADRLVVSAGPWLPALIGEPHRRLFSVTRQVMVWYDLEEAASLFLSPSCPVFLWELQGRDQGIYGFPAIDGPGGGIKLATEQYGTTTTPERIDRHVRPEECAAIHSRYVATYLAGVAQRVVRAKTCLYTQVDGARFIIDALPDDPRVMIVSPCSGHGFKHSAAIGEVVAERLLDGESGIDLAPFRFGAPPDAVRRTAC